MINHQSKFAFLEICRTDFWNLAILTITQSLQFLEICRENICNMMILIRKKSYNQLRYYAAYVLIYLSKKKNNVLVDMHEGTPNILPYLHAEILVLLPGP
jgi:hypothetical protein